MVELNLLSQRQTNERIQNSSTTSDHLQASRKTSGIIQTDPVSGRRSAQHVARREYDCHLQTELALPLQELANRILR